jgi:hypothetical protein
MRTSRQTFFLSATWIFASILGLACSPRSQESSDAAATTHAPEPAPEVQGPPSQEIDLFALGAQQGYIAPCGCTTEPLGGLQYAVGYIDGTSNARARLILEPGSLLFPLPTDPEAPADEAGWAQAQRRAALLTERVLAWGDAAISGVGPADVGSPLGGAALDQYSLPRVLTNVDPASRPANLATVATRTLDDPQVKVRTWVVLDPQLAREGLPALIDPVAALTTARAAQLGTDAEHLDIVVVHGSRDLARRVAAEISGLDLVVVGGPQATTEGSRLGAAPFQVGTTWVLEPGDRGQTLSHLTLVAPRDLKAPPFADSTRWQFIPPVEQTRAELTRLDERIASFSADPSADPSFLANLKNERARVKASIDATGPEDGVGLRLKQVKVSCTLPPDAATKKVLDAYDGWVAAENSARFKGVFTPSPPEGAPTYVGKNTCEDCHDEAVAFWSKTHHASAYRTLVDANKQFDLSCVGCHVTGFKRPGGAHVVETRGLVDVQCEQCHGPGSLHADNPDPSNIRREVSPTTCLECHTPEHSDTFQLEAYLRNVLGEGHGEDARAALGAGPTGRELRAAGLAKAGGACKKM